MGLDDRMRRAMRSGESDGGGGDVGAVRRRARREVVRRRGAFGVAALLMVVAVGATSLAIRDTTVARRVIRWRRRPA